MAQTIKLKRTAVSGKIPTTSNLDLGELAINTYDGRIFFEKDIDGTLSIQEILTTNSQTSGSFNLDGAISASSLEISGNTTIGGNLTLEGQLTIGDSTTDSVNIVASLSSSLIPENSSSFDIGSATYTWRNIYAGSTTLLNETPGQNNTLTVGANSTGDRFHVVTDNTADKGIILSSRSSNNSSDTKLSFSGSAFEFGGAITASSLNISGDVTATTGSFDVIDLDRLALTSTQTTVSPLHLTATTLNDGVGALRIDGAQADIYLNPTASTHTTVTFAVDGSPKLAFGMDSSDDFYITRNDGTSWYDDTFVLDRNTGEITLGYDLTVNGNINATNGIVSGSSQLTSSFDSRYLNVSGEGNISGSFTGSFSGDGSNITNITVDAAATVSSTFTDSSSITISHNFNTRNILVAVYDNQNNQVLPQNVNTSNLDQVVITLSSAQSGTVVVAKGGHIISGSAQDSNQLNGENASYYLDYDNFTDIPSGIVSGSSQTIENLPTGVVSGSQAAARGQLGLDTGDSPTFTDLTLSGDLVVQGTTTTLNTTTFNVEDNIIELNYGGTATEGGIFVKDSTGGSTTSGSLLWDATNDYWKAGTSGSESKVLLANGDSIVSSSAQTILHLGGTDIISGSSQLDGTTIGASSDIEASGSFSGSYKGDGSGLTGIQVDQVASVTASFSEQSTINVSHNFDSYNVIVSTYDTSYNQIIPQTVSLTDTNTVQVVLSAAHSGHVVVAKGGHVVSGSTAASNISGLGDEIQTFTSHREDVSGASFYNITHSLDESYPFVQAWNTSNNTMELPIDVESTSANVITVSFSATFAGKIIVKK